MKNSYQYLGTGITNSAYKLEDRWINLYKCKEGIFANSKNRTCKLKIERENNILHIKYSINAT